MRNNNLPPHILEEFDKRFGKIGPEGNCDSIGRRAGCDDCSINVGEREEHRAFLIYAISEARKDTLEKYNDFLLKNNYTDADIYAEEPAAIDRFLSESLTKGE